jgi:hypothetical protein
MIEPTFLKGLHRHDLYRRFGQTGAEIGVAEGKNALNICRAVPNVHLLLVDPWMPYPGNGRARSAEKMEDQWIKCHERLAPYNVTFMRMLSMVAVLQVAPASLDFVYIDGNHRYEYVLSDLECWSAKVKSGGIVAGHDYYAFRGAGVVEAVQEHLSRRPNITEWFLTDARRVRSMRSDTYHKEQTYFWVKP